MNLLIVSGLSGAGKSVAMNALEDIGFFCIERNNNGATAFEVHSQLLDDLLCH